MYNFGLIIIKLTEYVEWASSYLHLKYLNNPSLLTFSYLNGDILPAYILFHADTVQTL